MCLIVFALDSHPRYPLIVAANRDEFYDRPTEPARYWEEHPGLLAGRDVRAGGTWMGVTADLRFAAITNYRDPSSEKEGVPSRGRLVLDYLTGSMHPEAFLRQLHEKADVFNGFNLLAGGVDGLWYYSNVEREIREVTPGIHGLSNHLLDTPWPKVRKGKHRLIESIKTQTVSPDDLLAFLGDTDLAPDEELPGTGVSLEWERKLSAIFIRTPKYGTRTSTVLLIDRAGGVTFVERTAEGDEQKGRVIYTF